jgi:hypothetical protein
LILYSGKDKFQNVFVDIFKFTPIGR